MMLKILVALGFLFFLNACGMGASSSVTGSDDASTSGVVASVVGGALNGSEGGTLALAPFDFKSKTKLCSAIDALFPLHSASAATSCPTITGGGLSCSVSGSTATLTYSNCNFGASSAVWNGSQVVAFTGAVPTCGSAFPSTMTSVARTFGAGTTRISAKLVSVNVDTSGTYTAVDTNTYSGGTNVTFSSGVKTGLSISGINLWSGLFHHSLTTGVPAGGSALVITGGNTISSGTVVTFHNLAKVKALSSFSSVGFSAGCCTPTSGTISTAFSAIGGVTPTALGSRLVGTTESLTFTGCGTGTYTGIDGTSGSVSLSHCF